VSADWKLPWAGGCRCDRLRIRVSAPPLVTMACHCNGCQRITGSAYSMTLIVPVAGFEVTAGEPERGGLQTEHDQLFCPHCKSWVFTRAHGFDFVNVRASALDDHTWVTPFMETMTEAAFPWARTGALHSYPGMPPDDDFGMLVADFAAKSPRPS
jgi:hypothetical protein